ncbi:hypothetical protein RHMOL_Rhmol06G0025100 [Rhododendron molle]|uniref:Uncharacterized protein n=1 Tax=Rhododendron molle TaxID=49168 RepID=A0ACC0N8C4_RHOML|nr:hypothetical protein RHMOL_Rhmol06G0025100 [Rhododendron molle]
MHFEQAVGDDALIPFPGELYSGDEFRYKRDQVGAALARGCLKLRSDPASGCFFAAAGGCGDEFGLPIRYG